MAAAIPFIIAASAVMSAVGSIRQGQAAQASAQFNATVATQNADIARQEAAAQAQQQDRETYLRLGTIKANAGKNGGGMAGSALDVLADTAYQSKWETQQTLYQGELKARGYTNTANLDITEGENAKQASYMKAGSDLLGGAGNSYMSYKKLNPG